LAEKLKTVLGIREVTFAPGPMLSDQTLA